MPNKDKFRYNSDHVGQSLLTSEAIEKYTGLTHEELIQLSGFNKDYFKRGKSPALKIHKTSSYPKIVLKVEYANFIDKYFIEILYQIDIEKKDITNKEIMCNPTNRRMGLIVFLSQIKYAYNIGIKELNGNAHGWPAVIDKFNGFITWAKLGYTMDRLGDIENFKSFMKDANVEFTKHNPSGKKPKYLTANSLQELVSWKDGATFWEANGFDWHGKFQILPKSKNKNISILKKYIMKRNLKDKLPFELKKVLF